LRSHLTSSPNTVKEVDNKQELNQKSDDRTNGNKFINPCKVLEGIKGIKTIIPPWHPKHSQVVHRPKHHISRYNRTPEVDLSECFIHMTCIKLRIPMIYSCKHSKDRSNTHHQVKMSDDKICIMDLNIQYGIPHEKSGQTTGYKHRYKPYC